MIHFLYVLGIRVPSTSYGSENAGMTVDDMPHGWDRRQGAQAAAFDHIGNRYDEAFPHKDGQRDTVESLLPRLAVGARVLDVGCGTGLPTARQFIAAGRQVTGIDISTGMLDLARRNVPEATFECRDVMSLGDTDGTYDAVVAFFSLLMLPRDMIPEALRRIRDRLVRGGWFALGMVEADVDDQELSFIGQPVRVSAWPRGLLRSTVDAAGFNVHDEDVRTYAPATPEVPPEVQVFLLARRD